jgi:hypothetical protein
MKTGMCASHQPILKVAEAFRLEKRFQLGEELLGYESSQHVSLREKKMFLTFHPEKKTI